MTIIYVFLKYTCCHANNWETINNGKYSNGSSWHPSAMNGNNSNNSNNNNRNNNKGNNNSGHRSLMIGMISVKHQGALENIFEMLIYSIQIVEEKEHNMV